MKDYKLLLFLVACRFKDVFEADETVVPGNDESQDVTEKLEGLSVGETKESDQCDNDDNAKDTSNNEATNESGIKESANETGNDEATDKNQSEAEEKTPVEGQTNEENVAKGENSTAEATTTAEN